MLQLAPPRLLLWNRVWSKVTRRTAIIVCDHQNKTLQPINIDSQFHRNVLLRCSWNLILHYQYNNNCSSSIVWMINWFYISVKVVDFWDHAVCECGWFIRWTCIEISSAVAAAISTFIARCICTVRGLTRSFTGAKGI